MSRTGPLELLGIDHLFTEEERDIQAAVREFVDQRVKPNISLTGTSAAILILA